MLEFRRGAGGHRRFGPAAVGRLRLLRGLCGLGLSLPAIDGVLAGRLPLVEAGAAERAELETLAWRRATLRAVEEADPAERAARLELLASVPGGRAARDGFVAFWRRLISTPLPAEMFDMFLAVGVPSPPPDPTPEQAVAYAGLLSLVEDRSLERKLLARARANWEVIPEEVALLTGGGEAWGMVRPLLLAGRRPEPGPALER
ncbi:hypothetical protein RM590_31400 [Streptomyces sp. DSM 44938]|uniref:HTH merR-type domain-containing protein n=2 Tax=Streptomyces litchfieldiae TaxID=3075543 RepID=A0ABU2MZJ7_9ACTN|nr:hypothetical protein [Streptomyces sp. DSM 44938]MDT0347055.1 hypothetical protein [Streptomyces sp. DSM 44938]